MKLMFKTHGARCWPETRHHPGTSATGFDRENGGENQGASGGLWAFERSEMELWSELGDGADQAARSNCQIPALSSTDDEIASPRPRGDRLPTCLSFLSPFRSRTGCRSYGVSIYSAIGIYCSLTEGRYGHVTSSTSTVTQARARPPQLVQCIFQELIESRLE